MGIKHFLLYNLNFLNFCYVLKLALNLQNDEFVSLLSSQPLLSIKGGLKFLP